MERRARLGDVIDDYCTRCRMLMNHGIVGMVGDDVAKVRCNTCQFEHTYKHGRIPKRRRGETDRLFAEVLRGIRGEPDAAESAEPDEEPEAASGKKPEPGPKAAGRTQAAGRHPRAAAGHLKAAARHGRNAADQVGGKTTRPRGTKHEDERPEEHEEQEADLERADSGMSLDAGPDDEGQEVLPQGEDSSAAPPRDEEPEPTHGVRRKLFTIRRHSGGKPPVAGVTTDGSAERAARGQGQPQGGQGRFGARGGHGGGRHGHGGQGGHGGGGGRPDQQGRWPRRHRRRG